jgi:hypothetical protein
LLIVNCLGLFREFKIQNSKFFKESRREADGELSDMIETEMQNRLEADEALQENISNAVNELQEADEVL